MDLRGKNAVVLGVADRSSIAWAIATRLLEHGAQVHIGYQQRFFSRVRSLLQENSGVKGTRCDVTNEDELNGFFQSHVEVPIDILVHGIAFGPPEVFTKPASAVSADSFSQTLSISTHSLLKISGCAKPYLRNGGSIITLTYQASEQASPFYGMMGVAKSALESAVRYLAIEMGEKGIRVNAISPGPVETPAAIGEMLAFLRSPDAFDTRAGMVLKAALSEVQNDPELSGADDYLKAKFLWHAVQERVAQECAIQEFITQADVADCALFLAGNYAKKITGQVIHVDCGMSSSRLMPSVVPNVPLLRGRSDTEKDAKRTHPSAVEFKTGEGEHESGDNAHEFERPGNTLGVTQSVDGDARITRILEYLNQKFPDCTAVELHVPPEEGGSTRYFCVDGPNVQASLVVLEDFLRLSEAEITKRLEEWSVAEVLCEAGNSPLILTKEALRFAVACLSDVTSKWCPETLVSPDYDPDCAINITFPDEKKRVAFEESLTRLKINGLRFATDTDAAKLKVYSPRGNALQIIYEAERTFGAQVSRPTQRRLEWP